MSDNLTANDLRVGNFYYLNDIEVKLDERLLFAMFNDPLSYGLQNYTPIPLTEGWLVKLGIEFTDTVTYKGYSLNAGNMIIGFKDNIVRLMGQPLEHIKYVHQLQSLYYTLTQKELL